MTEAMSCINQIAINRGLKVENMIKPYKKEESLSAWVLNKNREEDRFLMLPWQEHLLRVFNSTEQEIREHCHKKFNQIRLGYWCNEKN